VQHTLWLLREVWIRVGLEKLENYKEITVRVLLDSEATGLFMDTTFAQEKGFKMEKLKKFLLVRNVDGTVNAGGAITYQVKYNMFFKGHVVIVVLWTSSHILYSLPLHQKSDISKATY